LISISFHFFSLHAPAHHLHLHSFPTRRSSDLYSLFREMMGPMKKLNDLEKTQLKHIAFTNTMMNAIQDQRRFIRDIKKLIRDEADRKSTRLNSSHVSISYAVFCLKKKTREGEN